MENKNRNTEYGIRDMGSIQAGRGEVLILVIIAIVIAAGWSIYTFSQKDTLEGAPHIVLSTLPDVTASSSLPIASQTPSVPRVTTIAESLAIPWDLAFLPNGNFLVTERGGTLVELQPNGSTTVIKLPHPKPKGEGGLLGVTLHPQFADNRYIYLYMSTSETGSITQNTVFRYKYVDGKLTDEKTIISKIPGALYHDGGRMEFGPDGLLYITTGDATISKIAQDKKSLGGKILRLTDEGAIPETNPFKDSKNSAQSAIYSYGHRNPQGLAWDSEGKLWETEHGRSGVLSGYDELNLVQLGGNYGWPTIEGPATRTDMISPVLQSGADDTWAPASLAYLNGKLYWGGLKGETLYEATIDGGIVKDFKRHLFQEFGRIRTVRVGPDGMLYLTTSNRDGRGTPKEGDDKIIRVNPALL
ncbi:MAG: PQQ-dependent sugar dehydrogenase [Patescibacteria group bacterium]